MGGGELSRIGKTRFVLKYMIPPARECLFDLHRYDVSDWAVHFACKVFNSACGVRCCIVKELVYAFLRYLVVLVDFADAINPMENIIMESITRT